MNRTINNINASIAEALAEKSLLVHGLAEAVLIRESEEKILPAIISAEGECDVNLFDDMYDAGFYHTLSGITYNEVAGWGDVVLEQAVHDMAVVVYGKRSQISPYDMEKIVCDSIRNATAGDIICLPISSDFNRLQVFATEFSGYPFFLQPDVFLFKVNYRITINPINC